MGPSSKRLLKILTWQIACWASLRISGMNDGPAASSGDFAMKTKSRRQFLKSAAVSTAGVLTMRSIPAWAQTTLKESIVPPLSVFGYSNVQLLDGPFRQQFEQNHELFLHLNEDGLLKPFRQRQGMPAPGPDLGGWYDNADDFNEENNFHGFIAGHTFGQYLSGLARAYAVTRSKPTQEKVHRLVRAFAETVEPRGSSTLTTGCQATHSTRPAVVSSMPMNLRQTLLR